MRPTGIHFGSLQVTRMLTSIDIVGHLAARVWILGRLFVLSFADLILYNFANDLEANVFEEQHWYSVMAKTHVWTLFSSYWALTNERYKLAVGMIDCH